MSLMTFIQASAHHMPQLADGSVQMIATSPPYYGLRKYAGEQDIDWPAVDYAPILGLPPLHVNAMRAPLGNEPTLEAYIAHLVLCLREWRRVLRDDGVAFVNLADSYASYRDGKYNPQTVSNGKQRDMPTEGVPTRNGALLRAQGIKHKDLMLVPHRFALAAQADGWFVRSDMIAAKVAPMPESVTDRPTRSHEHIWMLTKRGTYFCDMDAVREESADPEGSAKRYKQPFFVGDKHESGNYSANGAKHTAGMKEFNGTGRNLRDVLEWRPQGFSAAHFATWPEAIPEKLIRMGTSERGACPHCGAAWKRVVERTAAEANGERGTGGTEIARGVNGQADRPLHGGALWYEKANRVIDIGFAPSCTCLAHDPVPCVVLDPFSGSGTTAKVAARLGRQAIGVDISAEYLGEITAARMGAGFQMEMIA